MTATTSTMLSTILAALATSNKVVVPASEVKSERDLKKELNKRGFYCYVSKGSFVAIAGELDASVVGGCMPG